MDLILKSSTLRHQKMVSKSITFTNKLILWSIKSVFLWKLSLSRRIFFYLYIIVPSGSPLSFGGNATSSRSASISWNSPLPDQWNGVIILYVINVTIMETGHVFQLNSTTTSLTVVTLQPFRNYICIIAAVTSVGTGPFSVSFTLTTPQDGKINS